MKISKLETIIKNHQDREIINKNRSMTSDNGARIITYFCQRSRYRLSNLTSC